MDSIPCPDKTPHIPPTISVTETSASRRSFDRSRRKKRSESLSASKLSTIIRWRSVSKMSPPALCLYVPATPYHNSAIKKIQNAGAFLADEHRTKNPRSFSAAALRNAQLGILRRHAPTSPNRRMRNLAWLTSQSHRNCLASETIPFRAFVLHRTNRLRPAPSKRLHLWCSKLPAQHPRRLARVFFRKR